MNKVEIKGPGQCFAISITTKGRYHVDIRICFGIAFFENEEDAIEADKKVREEGVTYNGGFYDGMPCRRDKSWDYTDEDGTQWLAVTF